MSWRLFLGLAFVSAVSAVSWFSVPTAVIAIAATILVALHGKAGTLVELSFGPLKAKLQRDLSEAEKLVEKLRRMAVIQAEATLAASVRTGRFSDASDWQFVKLRATESALRDLGVAEDDIKSARSEFIRYLASDLGRSAMGGGHVPTKLGNEAQNEWQLVMKNGLDKKPEDIEEYLKRYDSLTPERALRIADMRWVLEHGDVRDREQYMRAHNPVSWD